MAKRKRQGKEDLTRLTWISLNSNAAPAKFSACKVTDMDKQTASVKNFD